MSETVRIDVWLWAVRLFKTRSLAAAACKAGHVKVGGRRAKAAQPVRIGDEVEVTGAGRHRIVEVSQLLRKRVGAPLAAGALIDRSPPPPPRMLQPTLPRRDPGSGRPTKRERRQITRLRGY